ncbi:cytochrome P450 2B1-like [Ostrea edulis]|uniref:cytochrome P450 2B1-like n=1 Tax=Ostrea edulis TaxID=37623 RepID=UPI0024AF28AB|nr:cytochrome P450 2B1-like [Ostrea edulis]
MDTGRLMISVPVVLLVVAIVAGFAAMFWTRDNRNLPPREPGIPFIGNVDMKPEPSYFLKLQKKHGDLFTLNLFGRTIIVACGYDTLKELLVKNGEKTTGHPVSFGLTEYFELSGMIGSSGSIWRHQRKFGHDALKAIDSGSDNIESRVLAEVQDFLKEVEKMEGKPFDVSRLIKISHCNIMSSLLFGKRFAHNDPTLTRLVDLVDEAMAIFPEQGILSYVEWLKYLPGDRFKVRRRRFLVDEIFKIVQKSVDEHKETLENPKNQDLIYSFLNEQKKRKMNNEDLTGFGDRDLLIMGYVLHFSSTPALNELYWYILYLMHNPDVVVRMRKEIQENVGMKKPVTMADQAKLPYCRAVMYEVLRMSTPVFVTAAHTLSEDIEVNGFTLPNDAWLMPVLGTANLDPANFPEPEKFKPERFLNENGELAGYEKVYMSFALGPRDCVAKNIAKMEMSLFLTTLVQNYDIENEPGKPLPSLEGISNGFRSAIPYEVCLKKRN